MSLRATIKAYATKTDAIAKLALIEIADWADDLGVAPIAVSQIAEFAGCTDIEAERAVERLIKQGVVGELPVDGRGRRFVVFTDLRL